jgi:HSP20 family molecular chaperone IbpA
LDFNIKYYFSFSFSRGSKRSIISTGRAYSAFERSVSFPEEVDPANVEGTMKEGVPELKVSKKEPRPETKARKIEPE